MPRRCVLLFALNNRKHVSSHKGLALAGDAAKSPLRKVEDDFALSL